MRSIYCVLLLVVFANAVEIWQKPYYNVKDAAALFDKFINDYNKVYVDERDKQLHFQAFIKTLRNINELNASKPGTYDINILADYIPSEDKPIILRPPTPAAPTPAPVYIPNQDRPIILRPPTPSVPIPAPINIPNQDRPVVLEPSRPGYPLLISPMNGR